MAASSPSDPPAKKTKRTGRAKGPATVAPQWARRCPLVGSGTPRKQAHQRIEDLEALLNADLQRPVALRELADRYPIAPPFGSELDDEGLAVLRGGLEAVRYYYQHGRGGDPEQTALLETLHQWETWPTELKPLKLWGMTGEELEDPDSGTLLAGMKPVPAGKLPHLLAGYYMVTARALVAWGLYPASHCRRGRCRRWFVPTRLGKKFCCPACRKKDERGE